MDNVAREHASVNTRKRLHTHIPRKPRSDILSAEKPDQLSQCVVNPRSLKNLKIGKFNSTCSMSSQMVGFDGIDSATISTESNFFGRSVMLERHESLSVKCRSDMNCLVSQKLSEGQLTEKYAEVIRHFAKHRHDGIEDYLWGASCVPVSESMLLHKHPQNKRIPAIVPSCNQQGTLITRGVMRSWNPIINFICVEDKDGHGAPIKACDSYSGESVEVGTAILWNFAAMFLGCSELWYAIDQKKRPFYHNEWEGHLLAHLHASYMKHACASRQIGSPFKGSLSASKLLDIFQKSLPDDMRERMHDEDEYDAFYGLGFGYVSNFFVENDHEGVRVLDNYEDIGLDCYDVDVYICVSDGPPTEAIILDPQSEDVFEARSVVCTRRAPGDPEESMPGRYSCERYARNKGCNSWWRQDRKSKSYSLMKKHYPADDSNLNRREYMPPFSALDVDVISYISGKFVPMIFS